MFHTGRRQSLKNQNEASDSVPPDTVWDPYEGSTGQEPWTLQINLTALCLPCAACAAPDLICSMERGLPTPRLRTSIHPWAELAWGLFPPTPHRGEAKLIWAPAHPSTPGIKLHLLSRSPTPHHPHLPQKLSLVPKRLRTFVTQLRSDSGPCQHRSSVRPVASSYLTDE